MPSFPWWGLVGRLPAATPRDFPFVPHRPIGPTGLFKYPEARVAIRFVQAHSVLEVGKRQ